MTPTSSVLHWHRISDLRLESRCGDWLFVITKRPNYDQHPRCDFEYSVLAYSGAVSVDLGTFVNDSAGARARCETFINSKSITVQP